MKRSKPLSLPRVGAAIRMPGKEGQDLGVVIAVNPERRLIVALMENGRQVELRVPANVPLKSAEMAAVRPGDFN